MKNAGKFMIGVAALLAAGALAGVLFAPAKGAKTRRRIANKSRDIFDSMNDTIEEGKDTLDDVRDKLKSNLEKVTDKLEHINR